LPFTLVIVVDTPGLRDIIYTSYYLADVSSIAAAGLSVAAPIAKRPTITSP
jgi:hypothetical protein